MRSGCRRREPMRNIHWLPRAANAGAHLVGQRLKRQRVIGGRQRAAHGIARPPRHLLGLEEPRGLVETSREKPFDTP